MSQKFHFIRKNINWESSPNFLIQIFNDLQNANSAWSCLDLQDDTVHKAGTATEKA